MLSEQSKISAKDLSRRGGCVYHVLHQIGRQLDSNVFPRVRRGGIVVPSEQTAHPSKLGKETPNVRSKQRRPEARPWTRTSERQRKTGRSGQACEATSLLGTDILEKYRNEVAIVHEAYPNPRYWCQREGLWLLTESSLLVGLTNKAVFLTGIACSDVMVVRSWGFWGGMLGGPTWIGPRHTNFPDGSICAFEPTDQTWMFGDPIVELLDLYSLWAVRHLHLEVFGRWPGYQAVHFPYERVLELKEDEFCGCGGPARLYRDCCRDTDHDRNQVADAVRFNIITGGTREPPEVVVRFIHERNEPPCLMSLLAT